jgi:Domain of unknown function (DUF4386)
MDAIKQQAQTAGVLYFLLGITAPIGLQYVPSRLFVLDNATATADRLRASGWLMHLGIGSELFHQVMAIFLTLALYRLFKAVDEKQAVLVVILGALVSVPIMFVNVLNEVAALILVSGAGFLSPFDKSQLDALAYLFLRLHTRGIDVASVFWGLWLFPFGALVIRSGFIPRVLGILLLIAGVGYLVAATNTLVLPQRIPIIGDVAGIMVIAEVPIIFWLLIWGAKAKAAATAASG